MKIVPAILAERENDFFFLVKQAEAFTSYVQIDIMDGFFDLDGKLPAQTDGGLKCFGHPIGASGLRMLLP